MPIFAKPGASIPRRSYPRSCSIDSAKVRSRVTREESSRRVSSPQPEERHMRTLVQFALRWPKLVVLAWVVMLGAAAPFASRLAGALRGSTDAVPGSPSELVFRDLNQSFGEGTAFVFPAVLTSSSIPTTDPRFAAAAMNFERVLDSAGMNGVRHRWNTGDKALLGRDDHSALLLVTPRAETFFDAESTVDQIREAARKAGLGPAFDVKVTGMISLFHDL